MSKLQSLASELVSFVTDRLGEIEDETEEIEASGVEPEDSEEENDPVKQGKLDKLEAEKENLEELENALQPFL